MVESTVKVSMQSDNNLDCSYAIVSKENSSVIIVLKATECAIFDYADFKAKNYTYNYLLLKHYDNESYAYKDFLKLIGKMCKKHEDSKYFLNHKNENNRVICSNHENVHMIREDEIELYQSRYSAFEQFVQKKRTYF